MKHRNKTKTYNALQIHVHLFSTIWGKRRRKIGINVSGTQLSVTCVAADYKSTISSRIFRDLNQKGFLVNQKYFFNKMWFSYESSLISIDTLVKIYQSDKVNESEIHHICLFF